jgi:high-affinity Fe2+/Pb2+ permease
MTASSREPERGLEPQAGGVRDETAMQHLDRNFMELLGELRVALPGVQVLFAFLLVVPFNQGYTRMSRFDKRVYFATLLCTALAAILLIAPTLHHRLEFHRGDKAHIVKSANRLAIAGLAALAVAMSGAILLVSNLVFGTAAAIVATAGILATFGAVWYGMPLRRRARLNPGGRAAGGGPDGA